MESKEYNMNVLKCVAVFILVMSTSAVDDEDCELHAPDTMHEFCCEIHEENSEFLDCSVEWSDKIHSTNDEQEMNQNFCISECVYNKTDYLGADRKSLRMKVIKEHLEELHANEEDEKLMYKTYVMCAKHAQTMLEHADVKTLTKRLEKYGCHPYPGLVFECVSNELILNCPPKKYHSSARCDHSRDYLKKCLKKKRR